MAKIIQMYDVIALAWIAMFSVTITLVLASLKEPMSASREAKARLIADLKSHRAVKERLSPSSENSIVQLDFKYWPFEVLYINEVDQYMTSVGYAEISWYDRDLAWNRSQYEGVSEIRLPFEVWRPSIYVTNSADKDHLLIGADSYLLMYSSGAFNLITPLFLKTTCDLNLDSFPFDTQECEIIFLPFFDDVRFNITSAKLGGMPDPFRLSGEWDIESRDLLVDKYVDDAPLIICKMKLSRRATFYIFNVLAPVVVTSSMTSLVFWIPPASGEKISFLVTVFMSNAVFLNFVAGTMPRNMSNVPRLTLFMFFVIWESLLAMVATIFVMRRYQEEQDNDACANEKAILKQVEEVALSQKKVQAMENKTKPNSVPSLVWKSSHPLEILRKLILQTAKFWPRAAHRCRGETRRHCCLRATTLDTIFFALYSGLFVLFITVLLTF